MGLGLFIAKKLLERSGATLEFSNNPAGDPLRSAVIRGVRPRQKLDAVNVTTGENRPIRIG